MRKRESLKMLCAAALLPAAPAALAQLGGRRSGKGGMDAGRRSGEEQRVDALETSLHELQEDLKLSTQQEPLWQAYADKVRALASDVARERGRRPAADAGTLLQRIDRVVDAARNRLTALEEIGLAAKALFESLSPEQKTPADPRLANIMALPIARNP